MHRLVRRVPSMAGNRFPELIVFDLDECLWSPEMYTLSDVPTKSSIQLGMLGSFGEGVVGVKSSGETIRLYRGALQVLQEIYLDKYPGMRIAAASSADTPQAVRIGRTAMGLLEILPGVTMREAFAKGWPEGFEGNLQIGRSHPLTSDKASTHFPILRKYTEIDYDKMLFFDDCGWGDHCGRVEKQCPGVVAIRTPHGLQYNEWEEGLAAYSRRYS